MVEDIRMAKMGQEVDGFNHFFVYHFDVALMRFFEYPLFLRFTQEIR